MTVENLVASTTELLHQWELEMTARRLSPKTIRERRRFVLYIDTTIGVAAELDEAQLRDFLVMCAKTKAATTQFNYHTILRMWFAWLKRRGYRLDDPTLSLGKPRLPRMTPRPAQTADLNTLLRRGNLQPQTRMKVLLAALQGLRCVEVARIRGEDVDFVAMKLRVFGKGNTDLVVDLHRDVASFALEDPFLFPKRGWWFPSPVKPGVHVLPGSVSRTLSHAFSRVGSPVTAHQLRHWTATELIRKDVPTRVVQKVMRHTSILTTEGYTAVADDHTAEAIRRLPRLES